MEYKKPKRIFEDAAVVDPEKSYYVPLENVSNTRGQDVKSMVDTGHFFSIFAPRQSGKTTFFEMFCHGLEQDNTYVAILLSFQDLKNLNTEQFYNSIEIELYKQLIKRLKDIQCDKLGEIDIFLESHRLIDHLTFKSLFIKLNDIIEYKKYGQYTKETNQLFTEDAVRKVFDETKGQTWLVNRIGTILTIDVKPETVDSIISEDVEKAIKMLLREQNSHFDNLVEKAKQYREIFIEVVFNGARYKPDDEAQSLLELHRLIKEHDGNAVVSNNIYRQRWLMRVMSLFLTLKLRQVSCVFPKR